MKSIALIVMVCCFATAQADIAAPAPDVAVMAPVPPTDQEIAGHSLQEFIAHHATVHYRDIGTTGVLARWRGGLQSICPETTGLGAGYDAFVTARIRALALYVGAPVQADSQCKSNVQIIFTDKPREKMDAVMKWATSPAFGNRYAGGNRNLIAFTGEHAIQGWYLTTGQGAAVLNTDLGSLGFGVLPVWPQVIQNHLGENRTGTRLSSSGSGSGVGAVILVVDTGRVVGDTIGTVADYVAMLTLSVAQSPDHCDPLPSILDLTSSNCSSRETPHAMTAGDIAFLKALYYKNTGLGPSLSRDEIEANMMRQFKLR